MGQFLGGDAWTVAEPRLFFAIEFGLLLECGHAG